MTCMIVTNQSVFFLGKFDCETKSIVLGTEVDICTENQQSLADDTV